ncbi:TRAP transporter substrate-binding protein [Bordetella sp. 15P40C-2]|uniref:TRAP transporter substrate-binding protein n=1 Tax=Bordetella sp. 15P40C-2 TaxID=2572246 RepID=UPI00132BB7F3|nr:TRAP transporter substrate-binding protein [Bordetella sp. 15P40C-2]MVW70344.1 C4-dicarboxylate ABC transporter [Bordetella sp. 15P40C-2]
MAFAFPGISKLAVAVSTALALLATTPVQAKDPTVNIKVAGMFGSNFKPIGAHVNDMVANVRAATDDTVKMRFFEPGALVPVMGIFDAVSSGSVDAGFVGIGLYINKEPGLALYNAAPFTPELSQFLAWIYYGGGQQVLDEVLEKHNMKAVFCGLLAPEAGGWFNKEVNSLDDFKGLKMRIGGLGANVLEKIGVSTQALGGGDVFPALERGVIDAAEFSNPGMDESMGFDQAAKYYYFPGWQNPVSPEWLIINKAVYNKLTDKQKKAIDVACGNAVARSIAEGEVLSMQAVERLRAKGVDIRQWNPEVVKQLKDLWVEEANRLASTDPNFKKVWESQQNFRQQHDKLMQLQKLP